MVKLYQNMYRLNLYQQQKLYSHHLPTPAPTHLSATAHAKTLYCKCDVQTVPGYSPVIDSPSLSLVSSSARICRQSRGEKAVQGCQVEAQEDNWGSFEVEETTDPEKIKKRVRERVPTVWLHSSSSLRHDS